MGLYKRNTVWWMRFKYHGQQVRRSTDTSDRRVAEAILAKITVDIVEGRYFEKREEQERTFAELMDRYLNEHVRKQMSQRSFRGYTKNLLPFFHGYTLAQITPKLIVAYKAKRYADGVAPATINRELACMKKAFNLAIREWEWCRGNPVARVSMEQERNRRDRWLSTGEEERLLQVAKPWLKDMILFALNTGMRMGEIRELTWEGVDLFRKTVTVFRSKNGERRTIPINSLVLDVLKSKAKVRSLKSDYVFPSDTFTLLDDSHLRRAFRGAMKLCRIKNFHFHDLRHTFATRLVQSGIDLYKVQCLLGHKSPIMTQRYAHHYPESLREGVEMLEKYRLASTGGTNLAHMAQTAGQGLATSGVSC
jgi:integrase